MEKGANQKAFVKFEEFRRKNSNIVYLKKQHQVHLSKKKKNFDIKNNFWANEQFNEIDNFCFKILDGIPSFIEGQLKISTKFVRLTI